MRLPDQISFEAIANAARRPMALLATVATLASGVALETPAIAGAHPEPNIPNKVGSPHPGSEVQSESQHQVADNGAEHKDDFGDAGPWIAGGTALLCLWAGMNLYFHDKSRREKYPYS